MGDKTEVFWFHVTPLFLFPLVLRSGGIRCGTDLSSENSPRRSSSVQYDDMVLEQLGNLRPSDCILLFRKPNPPLLQHKLSIERVGPWKAFPHIVMAFPAAYCLSLAGGRVFGSPANVGRTLRKGGTPSIRAFTSYKALEYGKVEEILLPAMSISERHIPITALKSVTVFSSADKQLVQRCLTFHGYDAQIELAEKPPYLDGQQLDPGATYLARTKEFIDAFVQGDEVKSTSQMQWLSENCFD